MTFPHVLRFRRVFNNVVELNIIYDIYINSDFKLLLYGSDQPQFITVTDSNGDPAIIPAYPFTGNEPYNLPKKQPTPFPYFSPEDIQANKEINDSLTGAERDAEEAVNIPASTADNITEGSGNEYSGDGEPITINGTDTTNDSDAKEKFTAAHPNLATENSAEKYLADSNKKS